MGGGDLNLKKSWHPSTMRNMEKVWKAEQQDNEEKKRIAELKREIAVERDKEEMKAFAMEQGVIDKKDDKKLDWMYKGPNESVNREEYLLGRPIDKQFEIMAQAEKDIEQNKPIKNHVEHECIPPSLRNFTGKDQVDLARKLLEDPLYAIKKKEMESRSQLLKNPVKLKQLRQLVAQQVKEDKRKSKKKKLSNNSDDSDSDKNLDNLLAAKFKKLKNEINEEDIIKSVKKHKNKKSKKKRKKDSETEESDTSESDSSCSSKKKKAKKHKRKIYEALEERNVRKRARDSVDKHRDIESKRRKEISGDGSSRSSENYHHDDKSSSRHKSNSYGLMQSDGSKLSSSRSQTSVGDDIGKNLKTVRKEQKWIPPKKEKLSEEEKERRRREMMTDASLRDKERARNVKKYEEQEKRESVKEASFDKSFVQKHLAIVAGKETVASRIKSNMNNIQRLKHSMDKNFAKR